MQTSRIDFNLRGVGIVLKERLLAVPIYQRSYSWETNQISEFWEDLRASFTTKDQEYFLGTIVFTKQGKPPRDSIIDGQQRLATTSILLAAIRDEYINRNDQTRADIIQKDYLSVTDFKTAKQIARMCLNSDDDFFFFKRVVSGDTAAEPSKKSHDYILNAYDYFRKQIAKVADDAASEWHDRLTAWKDFLSERVKAIVLEVPSEADAYLIFETLNDRGADLTLADLLKNYLFGHAGEKLDLVRDGWMQVLGYLEISSENALFTTFLRHYWSSKHGLVRERELYKSIKDHVTTETHAVEFINNLQKAATHYAALLNSDHEYWEGFGATVKGNVQTLLRLELEQNRPLFLAAMQHFTDEELKKLLRANVSWSVRAIIVGGLLGGGTAEKNYCVAAVKIRKGDIKTTEQLLKEISEIVPTDEAFTAAFSLTRVTKAPLARYYLIALENGKKNETEPQFVPNSNEEEVNLEHVLPKRASEEDWGRVFTQDERKDYVYRLGNLALLQKSPNGKIGSKPFSKKKHILGASNFALTKEIAKEIDWTKETINTRQNRLVELAVKVWPRS